MPGFSPGFADPFDLHRLIEGEKVKRRSWASSATYTDSPPAVAAFLTPWTWLLFASSSWFSDSHGRPMRDPSGLATGPGVIGNCPASLGIIVESRGHRPSLRDNDRPDRDD